MSNIKKTPHFSSLELLEQVTEELMWLNFIFGLSQIPWNLPVLHYGLQSPVSIQAQREMTEVDWDKKDSFIYVHVVHTFQT